LGDAGTMTAVPASPGRRRRLPVVHRHGHGL